LGSKFSIYVITHFEIEARVDKRESREKEDESLRKKMGA